jgi:transposase
VTLDSIDIKAAIEAVEKQLQEDKQASIAMKSAVSLVLIVVKLLMARLGVNSRNSSLPPANDPNRAKKQRSFNGRKPGGQPNHNGSTLKSVDDPDDIRTLNIDKRTLPAGDYQAVGFERRQIIDLRIERYITEFRAQILENADGKRFVAKFPAGVTRPAQYGASVKANAVYMSMFQLIPYERVQTHFAENFDLPISTGTLANFNRDAYERLATFEVLAKQSLIREAVVHADETGINVGGKRIWLHNASSAQWTLFHPHAKRGQEAMDDIGVLASFRGTLVHDHWKPYYRYGCTHALCNAHHLRELSYAHEEDAQQWAKAMRELLLAINEAVATAGGVLAVTDAASWRRRYRRLLSQADTQCPEPVAPAGPPKRGRLKRSKSRNLLERLRDYEGDVLRFMESAEVPFTNNQGERDIRMTKVQQKISGCFRSLDGAKVFCRIRSYLSTCRKNEVGIGEALECLFNDKWPAFIQNKLDDVVAGAE